MLRTLSAMVACAALAAAAIISIPAFVNASAPVAAEKNDRADAGLDCELRSWPYYARGCLRDQTRNAGRAVSVRIVTSDRIPSAEADAAAGPKSTQAETQIETQAVSSQKRHQPEAPSSWTMSDGDIRFYLAAGDFIRRTVPR